MLLPNGDLLVVGSAPHRISLRPVQPRSAGGRQEVDIFHSNSVGWMRRAGLVERHPICSLDNVLGHDWSRVVEVDPLTCQTVWEYRAAPPESFYSETRGASQRLSNGNTLITESDDGTVFEVTPEGEQVWRYLNPNLTRKREPSVLVRARRYDGLTAESMETLARGNGILWVD